MKGLATVGTVLVVTQSNPLIEGRTLIKQIICPSHAAFWTNQVVCTVFDDII